MKKVILIACSLMAFAGATAFAQEDDSASQGTTVQQPTDSGSEMSAPSDDSSSSQKPSDDSQD